MKKLFSILATLMLMGVSIDASAKAETTDWKECGDAAKFAELVKVNADIRLTNDIDLSTLKEEDDDYLFNQTFWGRIDGTNGNANVLGGRNFALRNRRKSAGKDIIIFKSLNDVEITNLNIYQCDFDGLDQESGLLSETCYNSTFNNMIFGDCQAEGDVSGYDCDRMGFVAGYAENSHFINLFFTDCTMITDGSKLGLVAGDAKDCEFTLCGSNMGCELWADGNLTSYNCAYVGGFCGYGDNCTFSKCYNFGAVMSDDDRVGGIVGYGTKCTITDCKNVGGIMHCKKDGFGRRNLAVASTILIGAGVILGTSAVASYFLAPATSEVVFSREALQEAVTTGQITEDQAFDALMAAGGEWDAASFTVTIATTGITALVHTVGVLVLAPAAAACLAVGVPMLIYTLNDPDEMGGIAGTLEGGSSVLRCWNGGTIECGDEDSGGIVGHLDGSSVESCYNRTFVKSHGKCTGGIVGYCKNGTVAHNLNVGVVDSESTPMDYIVGETSGTCTINNNHYLYDAETSEDSRAFTQEALPSGQIALTMNNELKAAGKDAVWRQKLGEDFYPVNYEVDGKSLVTATTTEYSLWQTVKTAEEFYIAVSNPLAKVNIEADLTLGNSIFNLATQAHPFKGEIKGNGHVVKNCHYSTTDEYKDGNCALFPYAMDAKFEDIILDGITISPLDTKFGDLEDMAILVAHSTRCEYKNITLRNCNILVNSDEDRLRKIGGLVCHSNYDKITDCTIESTCEFQSHVYDTSTSDSYVAGFAATAIESDFVGCHNAAKIKADDDRVAGIVADVTGGKIENCLNSGQIIGQGELGGIAGIANNVQIIKCVNVGGIDNDDEAHDTHRGGIVGYIKGNDALIQDCLNFGYINWSTNEREGSGCIDGEHEKDGTYGTGNYWYCQFNGNHSSGGDDTYTNEIVPGKYALDNGYYQSIDNLNGFCTNMPVPIAAAGTVYSNILCDGTQSYSNIYHSTAAHTDQADLFGKCKICGAKISEIPTEIHITDADGLNELARNVNGGKDFTGYTIYLDNDIDLKDVTYTPIGNSFNTPFRGTFDGQGHRIKNMSVYTSYSAAGVFGCVSGTTVIKNLVVDKSCVVNATGYGSAGIVGCMARESESLSDPISLTLDCCGNEATVKGDINAAGLVGGVYNTDTNGNATVTITNCYNAGNITGSGAENCQSAALIAYGNNNVTVRNCYNVGIISGYDSGHALIRTRSTATVTAENIYNYSNAGKDERVADDNIVTAVQIIYGDLYSKLNVNTPNVWTQNLETNINPVFGSEGLHYTRSMANAWGTIVLPYDVDYSQSNRYYKLYKLNAVKDGKFNFTEYADGTIPAGTPMLVKKLTGAGIDITAASTPNCSTTITEQNSTNASLPSGWTMKGTYSNLTDQTGIYYIASNKFWYAEEPITIAPFRAWFTGPVTSGAKAFNIVIDDETTGILNLNANDTKETNAVYNLNGQRLSAPQKGQINIINGKKIFVK